MSDSLREQMLQAGFKESAKSNNKKRNPKNKPHGNANNRDTNRGKNAQAAKNSSGPSSLERENIAKREAIAARKSIKAEIKNIIETTKIEDTKGELVHSYLVGKRIKQMFVNESVRAKLLEGTLVITRLNGGTYIVPEETGTKVRELNPDWVVIKPETDSETDTDKDDEYADYQVPDDLTW